MRLIVSPSLLNRVSPLRGINNSSLYNKSRILCVSRSSSLSSNLIRSRNYNSWTPPPNDDPNRVKSFWWISIPFGFLLTAAILEDYKNYFDFEYELQDLSTMEPIDSLQFWKKVYSSLNEAFNWEPYLNSGLVKKGLKDLNDSKDFLAVHDLNFLIKCRKMAKERKVHDSEWIRLTLVGNMVDAAHHRASRIVKALTRMCEMDGVAEEILDNGGLETLRPYFRSGRFRTKYYQFLTALCYNEELSRKMIDRPEFIPMINELLHSDDPQSVSVAYGVLKKLVENVNIGRAIYYDAQFEPIRDTAKEIKDNSDVARSMAKCFEQTSRYWPEHVIQFPKRDVFNLSLYQLPNTIAELLAMGAIGAIYCGIRWKLKSPSMSSNQLGRKMALGFAGVASPFIIRLSSHVMYNKTTKDAIDKRVHGKSGNFMASSPMLLAADTLRWSLFLTSFFASWYYGKYLLLPTLLTGVLHVFKIPSYAEWEEKGIKIKLKYT